MTGAGRAWLVGGLAAAMRVGYVLLAAPGRLPFPSDALWYHLQSRLIAHGHWFVNPFTFGRVGPPPATAVHPPLYPLVLAAAVRVGVSSVQAEQLLGAAIGVGTVVLASVLAGKLAGPRAALVTGLLAAVSPALWVTDGGVLSEGLLSLLVVAALLVAVQQHRRPSLVGGGALGALIGLAALTRAEAILLVPLLVIPLVARRVTWSLPRPAWAGCALAATALVLAPWLIRNAVTFQRPVTLSTGDGTLAGSNCAVTYGGTNLGLWSTSCYPPPPPGDESVVTGFWRDEGIRYAEHRLSRLPVVLAARVGREWSLFRPLQNARIERDDGRPLWASEAAVVGFWIVLIPAVAGGLVLRRRREPLWILLMPLVVVTATAAAVWGAIRFRAPAEVALVVLAGIGAACFREIGLARRDGPATVEEGAASVEEGPATVEERGAGTVEEGSGPHSDPAPGSGSGRRVTE